MTVFCAVSVPPVHLKVFFHIGKKQSDGTRVINVESPA